MKKSVTCKTCSINFERVFDYRKIWSGNCRACANKIKRIGKIYVKRRNCEDCNIKIYQYNKTDKCKSCWMKINLEKGFWTGKKRPHISGEKSHWWIKDRTKIKISDKFKEDANYKIWRKEVYAKDSWKCKIFNSDCKGRIEAHHILNWKDYPELRYEINNGITLCHAHHPRGRKKEAELSPYLKSLVTNL